VDLPFFGAFAGIASGVEYDYTISAPERFATTAHTTQHTRFVRTVWMFRRSKGRGGKVSKSITLSCNADNQRSVFALEFPRCSSRPERATDIEPQAVSVSSRVTERERGKDN
jgi:hypothetical protein